MSGIDIGKKIKARVEALGMSKSEFARRINTTPQNAFGIFKRKSIDTDMLQRICTTLNYDFFQYFHIADSSVQHTKEPGAKYKIAGGGDFSPCEELLKQAEKEISYLKKINELLEMRVVQQGTKS